MRTSSPARIVGVLALAQPISWGALVYASGALLEPMSRELGLSRSTILAAASLAPLVAAALAPRVGGLLDRRGPRPVLLAGSAVAGAALLAWSAATGIAGLAGAFALIGVAQATVLYEPAFAAVTRWAPEPRARAKALSLVTTAGGLAAPIFVPLATALAPTLGWRGVVFLLAALVIAVVLPAHAILPRVEVRTPYASPVTTGGMGALVLSIGLQSAAATGFAMTLVAAATAAGHEPAAAALAAALLGGMQLPGRWIWLLFPPASRGRLLAGTLALQFGTLTSIALLPGGWLLAATAIFGAANGVFTLLRAAVPADWYGAEGYAGRSGALARAALLGRAAGPYLCALVWESAGDVRAAWILPALLLAAADVAAVVASRRFATTASRE